MAIFLRVMVRRIIVCFFLKLRRKITLSFVLEVFLRGVVKSFDHASRSKLTSWLLAPIILILLGSLISLATKA